MLTDEHYAVNMMIDRGAAFDQIEDYINTLALPSEQLSALWLLAWAEAADPATRQQAVRETLAVAREPFHQPFDLSRNRWRPSISGS
jgi:hypothetical protein